MSFADGDEQNAAKAQFLFLMKIVSSFFIETVTL